MHVNCCRHHTCSIRYSCDDLAAGAADHGAILSQASLFARSGSTWITLVLEQHSVVNKSNFSVLLKAS